MHIGHKAFEPSWVDRKIMQCAAHTRRGPRRALLDSQRLQRLPPLLRAPRRQLDREGAVHLLGLAQGPNRCNDVGFCRSMTPKGSDKPRHLSDATAAKSDVEGGKAQQRVTRPRVDTSCGSWRRPSRTTCRPSAAADDAREEGTARHGTSAPLRPTYVQGEPLRAASLDRQRELNLSAALHYKSEGRL